MGKINSGRLILAGLIIGALTNIGYALVMAWLLLWPWKGALASIGRPPFWINEILILLARRPGRARVPGEDHVDGNEQKQDAARCPQRRQRDAEDGENAVAEQAEKEQDRGGDEHTARCHREARGGRLVFGERGEDEGDVGDADCRKEGRQRYEESVEHRTPQRPRLSRVSGGQA